MEQALLLMSGICLLVMGLSYLIRAREWNAWLQVTESKGKQASLIFGSINLLIGSFIVAFHPVWTGIPIILTIMGVIAIGKGSFYLLFPDWLPQKLKHVYTSEKPILQASGIVLMVIALLLLGQV